MKKLYTLDVLINQTEPNELPDSHLFSMHTIENQKNMMMIEEGTQNRFQLLYDFLSEKYVDDLT